MSYWFYVYQGGQQVASGNAPTKEAAESEMNHYALVYGKDGPVRTMLRRGK